MEHYTTAVQQWGRGRGVLTAHPGTGQLHVCACTVKCDQYGQGAPTLQYTALQYLSTIY